MKFNLRKHAKDIEIIEIWDTKDSFLQTVIMVEAFRDVKNPIVYDTLRKLEPGSSIEVNLVIADE